MFYLMHGQKIVEDALQLVLFDASVLKKTIKKPDKSFLILSRFD